MTRPLRLLIGLPLFAGGVVLGLYGLIALLYTPDGGGNGYVTLFGRETDARIAGAIALVIALAVISLSVWLLRWRGSRAGSL